MANTLYYGDNLDILRTRIPDESVDLVYLDPPFNSNRSYNVLFRQRSGEESRAQIEAFDDTWTWSQESQAQYDELLNGGAPGKVVDALEAMRRLLGDNDVLAYLVMMTARLIELRRVLKRTGSLYLHCDPTASHYLKIVLDAIFGATNFRNEIIWKRADTVKGNFGQGAKFFDRNTDTILFYANTDQNRFNPTFKEYSQNYIDNFYKYVEPETGRRYQLISMTGPGGAAKGNPRYEVMGVTRYWRYSKERMQELIDDDLVVQTSPGAVPRRKLYLDEGKGVPVQSLWDDLPALHSQASERLGYPTQKPLILLERIVAASSSPGDVVLDPFAGCGTAIDAAQKLGRRWIGIDVTYIAIDLIEKRLRGVYGNEITQTYQVDGIPTDMESARALFNSSPKGRFDFERWAVSLVDGQPNEKQVGDKGVDGRCRFILDSNRSGHILVSVKGGATNPGHVRDLVGTMQAENADMGIFICMQDPTKGILEVANRSGLYTHPANGQKFPKVQILTIRELLDGKRPKTPVVLLPYVQAQRRPKTADQQTLDDE